MRNNFKKTAFVVATKDRPKELRQMLESLLDQSHKADQVIIVDSSSRPLQEIEQEYSDLHIKYMYYSEPSASAQRNVGIRAVESTIELIGILDDDVVLEHDALENMLIFWEDAPDDLGGCAFNWLNLEPTSLQRLKRSKLVRLFGLYSNKRGAVVPSGWQTLAGRLLDSTFADWLPSGASIWRAEIFEKCGFDEFFDGYSYLEDVDFSLTVGKKYRLAIVADAGFNHYPSQLGRIGSYEFGRIEVINRIYLVTKHCLSLWRCYLGLLIRMLMTIIEAVKTGERHHRERALGNLAAILESIRPT